MLANIYLYGSIICSLVFFLFSALMPALKSGREFIKESISGTKNYLMEIIEDIDSKKPKLVVYSKFSAHLFLSGIISVPIGFAWPLLVVVLMISIFTYIIQKNQKL